MSEQGLDKAIYQKIEKKTASHNRQPINSIKVINAESLLEVD